VPFQVLDEFGKKGKILIWIGKKTNDWEIEVARSLVDEEIEEKMEDEDDEENGGEIPKEKGLLNKEMYPVELVEEGSEPELFWEKLGGKKPYETDAEFMNYSRLFRCTNEKGYFCVSEKTIDFCQDDLDDDDIMILDNGDQVFLWVGSKSSEVEVKLAYKSAQVYIQHLRLKQPNRPRKLCLTLKGKESRRFTKCFHAFSKHKVAPE